MAGHAFGQERRSVHDPGEETVGALEGGVPEFGAVPHGLGVPAEHVAVEGDRRVVVARPELEPAGRVGLAELSEAGVSVGLPAADGGAAGVGDHEHRALVADGHWMDDHLSAKGPRLLHQEREVGVVGVHRAGIVQVVPVPIALVGAT